MSEKPIERLNYFNGQRLQATDLRLEQDYHIRVRRWLNRSLYKPGIAVGLEVYPVPGAPKVRVSPGLAIDAYGREIILLDSIEVSVTHDVHDKASNTTTTYPTGPYLVVRYNEQMTSLQDPCCTSPATLRDKPAIGGPSRILAAPVFECVPYPPPDEPSGKVMLGLVILAKNCSKVERIDTTVRRYVGDALDARVKQYALEGEREVAAIPIAGAQPLLVKGIVRFHIRGRQPNSVTLYLKARSISSLHYTELGSHLHSLSVTGGTEDPTPALTAVSTSHHHDAGPDPTKNLVAALNVGVDPAHPYNLKARKGYVGGPQVPPPFGPKGSENSGGAAFFLIEEGFALDFKPDNFLNNILGIFNPIQWTITPETDSNVEPILDDVGGSIEGGEHTHTITGITADGGDPLDLTHQHTLSGSGTSGAAGAADPTRPDIIARAGKPLSYIYDLHIAIDGVDKTQAIKDQIATLVPATDVPTWSVLGNGTKTHPLADETLDALPIRVDFVPGVVLDDGEHSIEFSVGVSPAGDANGGCINYNLYVE